MSRYNRFYNRRKRYRKGRFGYEDDDDEEDDTRRLSRLDEYGYEIPHYADQPIDNERQFYSQYHIGRPSTGIHENFRHVDWWSFI